MGTAIIFGSFASLIIFYAMNKSNRNRKANNRQRFMENQMQLLSALREKSNNVLPTDERSPSTNAQDKLATEAS